MIKTSLASVGGIAAAVIASLCCIGPVLVVFLGVGGIAAFSVFEVYRPHLIGLTVLLIGLAFYLTYRKREVKCEDGTCKVETASEWTKTGVWGATLLAIAAIGFPYLGFAPQVPPNEAVRSTAFVTLNISGMDCKACAAGVEGSLANINGVRRARVNFQSGEATVEYDNNVVKAAVFVDRVSENGFTATIKKGK